MSDTVTSLPKIGDPGPDFTAVTTQSANMKFSKWRDQPVKQTAASGS